MASTMGDVSKLLAKVFSLTSLSIALICLGGVKITESKDIGVAQNNNIIPQDPNDPLRFGNAPNANNPPVLNNLGPVKSNFRPNVDPVKLQQRDQGYKDNLLQVQAKKKTFISDRISSSPECRGEYETLCPKTSKMNNFAVLECLQNTNKETGTKLSAECNQHLWDYKKNLTEEPRFLSAATSVCSRVKICEVQKKAGAELLSCLIENSDQIEDTHCRQFVNRMEVITFSDYRLIKGFYESCSDAVRKLQCGSVHQEVQEDDKPATHMQGFTIQCLESKIKEVNGDCRSTLLRVAELSADDYHKDRALYFACRDDRERFCEKELAGDGRIYKCLEKHKKEKMMSTECFDALSTRQRLISSDVKVDKQLIKNCRNAINERNCQPTAGSIEQTLSSLLLCLESDSDEDHSYTALSGECVAELFDIRKSLMEDYKLNPEIVTSCADDIEEYCKGLRKEGKTLHCLMERAMKRKLSQLECSKAVLDLLEEVKAGSDYRLDPILASSCEKSRAILCSKVKSGDSKVLSCLMDNIESELMEEKCSSRLYELQYFISRDFKLDINLHRSCKQDAERYCSFQEGKMDGETFACLNLHLHNKKYPLSIDCASQVHRALRQRASSVSLNPSIEKKCRIDLGRYCTSSVKEFSCLQDHYISLETECRMAIKNFTREESEDVRMNKVLMKACSPMLKRYCQDSLKKKVDEGDALDCLIRRKNDADMDPKCAAGIEHFQIIQLKDYTLSYKFKKACKEDVQKLCSKKDTKKDTILTCLSKFIRTDTLLGYRQNVSESCRAQVKFEMLQESESIKLDPVLGDYCKADLDKFCALRTKDDGASLECLRKYSDQLTPKCYKALFNKTRELEDKPEWDYFLMKVCQSFIKTTCKSSPETLMDCLQNHVHDELMDENCREAVSQRMGEEARDFRLNPTMRRVCFIDMGKYCQDIRNQGREDRNLNLEGGMMTCLQKYLFETEKKLSPLCEKYVRHFTVETALNYELDPKVKKACSTIAKSMCAQQITQPGEGLVVECLKGLLQDGRMESDPQCRGQIIKLTNEGLTDIQVDPQLAEACSLDLKHYCHGIMRGQGQQMACLLEALEDKSVRLKKECKNMLEKRKELWEFAAEVAPPETLNELYLQISHSSSRNHFFMSFLSFIAGVLFFGVCCGRATKRISAGVKNK